MLNNKQSKLVSFGSVLDWFKIKFICLSSLLKILFEFNKINLNFFLFLNFQKLKFLFEFWYTFPSKKYMKCNLNCVDSKYLFFYLKCVLMAQICLHWIFETNVNNVKCNNIRDDITWIIIYDQ